MRAKRRGERKASPQISLTPKQLTARCSRAKKHGRIPPRSVLTSDIVGVTAVNVQKKKVGEDRVFRNGCVSDRTEVHFRRSSAHFTEVKWA